VFPTLLDDGSSSEIKTTNRQYKKFQSGLELEDVFEQSVNEIDQKKCCIMTRYVAVRWKVGSVSLTSR
jgi:hypothetical protein